MRRGGHLAALTCLLGVVAITLVALIRTPGFAQAEIQENAATAWLVNENAGVAWHAFGYSAEITVSRRISEPGAALSVTQTPHGAWILDQQAGHLLQLSDASLTAAASAAPARPK